MPTNQCREMLTSASPYSIAFGWLKQLTVRYFISIFTFAIYAKMTESGSLRDMKIQFLTILFNLQAIKQTYRIYWAHLNIEDFVFVFRL